MSGQIEKTAEDGTEEPDSSGSNPGGSADETTIQDLAVRVDALSTQLDDVREQLDEEREQRRDLERQLDERDERIADLEDEVNRLDARTDLLEIVENADQMDARQRAVTLVQHLHRAAKARERRDEPPAAAVNRNEAEEALHYPDVERTTIYRDMERAARLVGNEDVLKYADGELRIDLNAGTLPGKYSAETEGENL